MITAAAPAVWLASLDVRQIYSFHTFWKKVDFKKNASAKMTTSKFVANDPFGGRDLLSNQNDPSHCIYMIFCKSQAPTYCGGQLAG